MYKVSQSMHKFYFSYNTFFLLDLEYESKQKGNIKKEDPNTDSEFPHKKRNIFLAALFSAAAMLGYAVSTGIVQIVSTNTPTEDEDNET